MSTSFLCVLYVLQPRHHILSLIEVRRKEKQESLIDPRAKGKVRSWYRQSRKTLPSKGLLLLYTQGAILNQTFKDIICTTSFLTIGMYHQVLDASSFGLNHDYYYIWMTGNEIPLVSHD